MNRLVKTESFKMLFSNDSTTATNNLIKEVTRLRETEVNLASLYRTLHYTRFHLESMIDKSGITTETGKKCGGTAFCH